jgi:hypothetical protein
MRNHGNATIDDITLSGEQKASKLELRDSNKARNISTFYQASLTKYLSLHFLGLHATSGTNKINVDRSKSESVNFS